jgi:hypothetical protein
MRIKGDGKVGIGVATPARTLQVGGQTYISSGGLLMHSELTSLSTRPTFVTGSSTSASYEIRSFNQSTNNNDGFLRLRAGGGGSTGSVTYIDLSGYSTSSDMNDNIVFGTSGTERVRIIGDGKVGIGTNNPLRKLHVYDIVIQVQLPIHM